MHNNLKLQKIIWDSSIIGFAQINADGKFLAANPALCALLEYTETELLDRTFQQITHPDDLHDDSEMAKKVFFGEIDSYVMTKRYITKTEKVIWIKLKVVRVLKEDNSFDFFFSQISPTVVSDLPKQVLPPKEKASGIIEFFKRDWKWVLATVIAVITFIAKEYHRQQETAKRLDNIELMLEKLAGEDNSNG
jgi:PAS domain S-box-containing protein